MPKVDILKLEKEAEKANKLRVETEIIEKEIGGKKYFKGPYSADWFDDYGDCLSENSNLKRINEFRLLGLDEFGRTPELVKMAEAKAKLFKQREELLKDVLKIDDKIRDLKAEDFMDEDKKTSKKRK